MGARFAVVDLFAGAGGLGEGFSAFRDADGHRPFSVCLSVERDSVPCRTLRIRSFLHQFDPVAPLAYHQFLAGQLTEEELAQSYPAAWAAAEREVLHHELGDPARAAFLARRVGEIAERHGPDTVLVGGPPCQAYSLVGRARNKGVKGYEPSRDERHFLYREYLRILSSLQPAAFVIENVRGILSARVGDIPIFPRILEDLRSPGIGCRYVLTSLPAAGPGTSGRDASPGFLVRADKFGVPQARERVIIIGIREDVLNGADIRQPRSRLPLDERVPTVSHRLGDLPRLRSRLSRGGDSTDAWLDVVRSAAAWLAGRRGPSETEEADRVRTAAQELIRSRRLESAPPTEVRLHVSLGDHWTDGPSSRWSDEGLRPLRDHASRSHMPSDLRRYLFAALYASVNGRSPVASEFPVELAPHHASWDRGHFPDRFRVQLWDKPASTITSHIAKDGHAFIHPDPLQCRSLTVREAARLQTFPDNYYFAGNRTQQFVQIGNAVPPLLAMRVAGLLHCVLVERGLGQDAAVKEQSPPAHSSLNTIGHQA